MERAKELFERVKVSGQSAIDDFIANRTTEELFLDFKRSADNGRSRTLHNNDRKNLAKAISGFGNSAGGVVVWGVDCSMDNDGADVARAKIPIQNVQRFLGNLQGAVSGCTIPPHSGVEHFAISSGESDYGFVVTYIPASECAPHQVINGNQYYIRAGSDFIPTPHHVLAGMFGRRPQPDVFEMFSISPASHQERRLVCDYGIMITNRGPGIARDLFFNCMMHHALGDETQISWQFLDHDNWSGNFLMGRHISIVSHVNVRVPPGAILTPLSLRIEIEPPFETDLLMQGNVGCSGAPTRRVDFQNDRNTVADIYRQYFDHLDSGTLTVAICHHVAEALLKCEQSTNPT